MHRVAFSVEDIDEALKLAARQRVTLRRAGRTDIILAREFRELRERDWLGVLVTSGASRGTQ